MSDATKTITKVVTPLANLSAQLRDAAVKSMPQANVKAAKEALKTLDTMRGDAIACTSDASITVFAHSLDDVKMAVDDATLHSKNLAGMLAAFHRYGPA